MSQKNAEILLASVIIARSTSYLFSKICLDSMGPFNLLGIRFLIAGIILLIIYRKQFHKLNKSTFKSGIILGFTLFAMMSAELIGLKTTDSSMVALIENTSIVMVPILSIIIYKKFPEKKITYSIVMTFIGVMMITYKGSSLNFNIGEIYCLLAALLYAFFIILTDRLVKNSDPTLMGIIQILSVSILALIASFTFETPQLPSSNIQWISLMVLVLVCTVFGYTFQPIAQKQVSAEKTSQFCGLNPLTATLLGALFMGDQFTVTGIIGIILIMTGLYISSKKTKKRFTRLQKA